MSKVLNVVLVSLLASQAIAKAIPDVGENSPSGDDPIELDWSLADTQGIITLRVSGSFKRPTYEEAIQAMHAFLMTAVESQTERIRREYEVFDHTQGDFTHLHAEADAAGVTVEYAVTYIYHVGPLI